MENIINQLEHIMDTLSTAYNCAAHDDFDNIEFDDLYGALTHPYEALMEVWMSMSGVTMQSELNDRLGDILGEADVLYDGLEDSLTTAIETSEDEVRLAVRRWIDGLQGIAIDLHSLVEDVEESEPELRAPQADGEPGAAPAA